MAVAVRPSEHSVPPAAAEPGAAGPPLAVAVAGPDALWAELNAVCDSEVRQTQTHTDTHTVNAAFDWHSLPHSFVSTFTSLCCSVPLSAAFNVFTCERFVVFGLFSLAKPP